MMLRYIYTFFVAVFLAIFIGMGIAVFYSSPTSPKPPIWYEQNLGKDGPNDTQRQEESEYLVKRRDYDTKMFSYNRNVSIIVLICAVIILSISLLISEKVGLIADGMLLGGIFTLLYGIGRGMATDSNKFRFIIATLGLAVTIGLGYIKFIRRDKSEILDF